MAIPPTDNVAAGEEKFGVQFCSSAAAGLPAETEDKCGVEEQFTRRV